ncbi:MAG TPA: type 4a pilus biogenesis protein PilO [Longimicrobiales bacterium]|nr:type 4a pilus biogenesis protein PilO [Longimicrobiales bacterium]
MALLPQDPAKQKKLLAVMAPLVALGGYWYFFHGKATEEIDTMAVRLETMQAQNRSARTMASTGGAELERRLEIYEQYTGRLERLIPSRDEVPQLLSDISERAQQVGVDLALVRPETEAAGPYYTRQTYEMGVTGRYHEVGLFLSEIGSLPRIITPIDLEVSTQRGNAAGGDDEVQASFRIETYVLPRPGEVADTTGGGGDART